MFCWTVVAASTQSHKHCPSCSSLLSNHLVSIRLIFNLLLYHLQTADCWLAFNVPMSDVATQAEVAKAAGVKKLVRDEGIGEMCYE